MKVLVVGGGGREHALVWKLFASPRVEAILCTPGNAGTAALAQTMDVQPTDLSKLLEAATRNKVDLTIVGPEAPLADGIVDLFASNGLKCFGPTQAAAQLEWSKVWAKEFLLRHGIPTGRAEVVDGLAAARSAVARFGLPVAIKADGLAGGKGVWVAKTGADADAALDALFNLRVLGKAGERVLIEEYLTGRELSALAFTDGERLAVMPPARDYKRLGEGDTGPNTGGMGGYTRPQDATPELLARIERDILRPTVAGMAAEGRPYRGVLYTGLMLTPDGPKVLEFNCRFGDPEAQLILPLLESDLLETCLSAVEGRLDPGAVRWGGGVTCGVVLAAEGYPGEPKLGATIRGLDDLAPGILAFHGGTRVRTSGGLFGSGSRSVVTAGGRVVTVVATAPSVAAARELVYENLRVIDFQGKQLRPDIGSEGPGVGWHLPGVGERETPEGDAPEQPQGSATSRARPNGAGSVAVPSSTERMHRGSSEPGTGHSGLAAVALLASNDGERVALAETVRVLEQLGIQCQASTVSAFHGAGNLEQLARNLAPDGVRVVVAAAGDEPALPGLVGAWSGLPVIAVPTRPDDGASSDALVAATQVPEGVPVAVVGPGARGARTAAWLAASILGLVDEGVAKRYGALRGRRMQVHA
jgi:phosphoribosylamine--glycine ligase